jgi:hypothetical protein
MALIEVVGAGLQPWHTTESLRAVGAQIGIVTIDSITSTVSETSWISQESAYGVCAPSPDAIDDTQTLMVAKFKNSEQLTNFWALTLQRAGGSWYHELNDSDGADTTNDAGGLQPSGAPTVHVIEPAPHGAGGPTDPQLETKAARPDSGRLRQPHLPPGDPMPSVLAQLVKTDRLIGTLAENEKTPITEPSTTRLGPGFYQNWTIPQAIVSDNNALDWILARLDQLKGGQLIYDPLDGVTKVKHQLAEQKHLNGVREIAGKQPDPPDARQ